VSQQLATRAPEGTLPAVHDGGSVMLATFDVPFDEAAAAFAVDSALESSSLLLVVNVVELPPLPMSVGMGTDLLEYAPEMAASLLAPAARAQALGVRVERLRVKSFHRVDALVEVAAERKVRLLVLGPDAKKVSRRLYRKAAAAVRDRLDCLVWITWDLQPL
jgi:nucleotide-binding universal stress UspA family protein